MTRGTGIDPRQRDRVGHLLAWFGGVAIALTPWVGDWTIGIGGSAVPVRFWPGNFIVALLSIAALGLIGATWGGAAWLALRRHHRNRASRLAMIAALWGIAGLCGFMNQIAFWLVVLPLSGIGSWAIARRLRDALRRRDRLSLTVPWNGVLCGVMLALAMAGDCTVLGTANPGPSAAAGLMISRLFTQLALAGAGWALLQAYLRCAPQGTRWLAGAATWMALVSLLAELGMNQLWGKSLLVFFGEFVTDGRFDLARLMEGGHVDASGSLALRVAAALAGITIVHEGTRRASRRFRLRAGPHTLLGAAATAWVLLLAGQAAEPAWIDRAGRWLQRRALRVHLTPSFSQPGMASFDVVFKDAALPDGNLATRRPDIHWFVVESLRADALCPGITPFLCAWRDSDCQPVAAADSASNATHLSWFAMLHGKPAVFWEPSATRPPESSLLHCLRQAGYRNELRSAAPFDFMNMHRSVLDGGALADLWIDPKRGPGGWPDLTCERDRRVVEDWKSAVRESPPGGVLRLSALDSPHFPHAWPASFTPPHADYFPSEIFPFRPDPGEIRLVRNRYENSIAYVDTLLRECIEHLRQTGRYDDAMIVVTGDHGEEFQERGFWFHASALARTQTTVPVLIKWPRSMGRGDPVTRASHLDLVPSILDAIGIPESACRDLPGRSLQRGDGAASTLVTTHFAAHDGEGMHWRRGDREAAFSWHRVWAPGRPARIWLERLSGPDGPRRVASAHEAEQLLREWFPDAADRWFTRFEAVPAE